MIMSYGFAVARKSTGSHPRFEFGITNASKIFIGVGAQRKIQSLHGMTEGNWYHWTFTFAGGTNGALKAYRDGTEIDLTTEGENTSTWSGGSATNGYPIYLGGRNGIGSYDNGWACNLDEVAIFDEVKSSSYISHILYNTRKPKDLREESGLVGYWRLENNTKDLSSYGNHGTLTVSGSNTALPTFSTDVPE